MGTTTPPSDLRDLLARAEALCGTSVGSLSRQFGGLKADGSTRTKGRVGELVEQALGATAGNLDLPDFPHLGVELKTIPLDERGRVQESTFVCAIDMATVADEEWQHSRVWRKLRCVLWMPVEAACVAPLRQRRLGRPRLWRPDPSEQGRLQADWELLMGQLAVGGVEELSAHAGEVLQVRPKAANSAVNVEVWGPQGEAVSTVPRGFYLRAKFTERVLWRLSSTGCY